MCFGKTPDVPKPKPPLPPPTRADVLQAGDDERRRLAFRRGFASTIKTTPLGDPNFGKAAAPPALGV